ncbi:hypothetical protein PRIPAC_72129 [Pristionchus pacificus]|uniref:Uncharacterized protein n=1 Tax=Pristionchus pacificus TaxID=54126 RepID=A0A2A6CFU6_PRIPA|nr:hypothetical protein PRIPAC_72129 [Pristionchus pacificus]|eukprot:PDM77009.1 hypothetical protein PRIPAC_42404 [Pristionchus pacificus]
MDVDGWTGGVDRVDGLIIRSMVATLMEAVLRHRVNLVSILVKFAMRRTGLSCSPVDPSVESILFSNCCCSSSLCASSSIDSIVSLIEATISLPELEIVDDNSTNSQCTSYCSLQKNRLFDELESGQQRCWFPLPNYRDEPRVDAVHELLLCQQLVDPASLVDVILSINDWKTAVESMDGTDGT